MYSFKVLLIGVAVLVVSGVNDAVSQIVGSGGTETGTESGGGPVPIGSSFDAFNSFAESAVLTMGICDAWGAKTPGMEMIRRAGNELLAAHGLEMIPIELVALSLVCNGVTLLSATGRLGEGGLTGQVGQKIWQVTINVATANHGVDGVAYDLHDVISYNAEWDVLGAAVTGGSLRTTRHGQRTQQKVSQHWEIEELHNATVAYVDLAVTNTTPSGKQRPASPGPLETFLWELTAVNLATLAEVDLAIAGPVYQIEDDAVPSLSINDVTILEGNAGTTPARFRVTLSNPSQSTVTVNFATADGTATAGSDYVANTGLLTFPPGGPTSQTIIVLVNGDNIEEPDETFSVTLSDPTNATLGKDRGIGTIRNDDGDIGRRKPVAPMSVKSWGLIKSLLLTR
jgi:hypothetical protein